MIKQKNSYGIVSGHIIQAVPELWSRKFVDYGMYRETELAREELQKELDASDYRSNWLQAEINKIIDAGLTLQKELDAARTELKNKDAVRLWNECELLRKQLADATQRELNLRSDWLEARQELADAKKQIEEYEDGLKSIISLSHSWVITREYGQIESAIHSSYRKKAIQLLEASKGSGQPAR